MIRKTLTALGAALLLAGCEPHPAGGSTCIYGCEEAVDTAFPDTDDTDTDETDETDIPDTDVEPPDCDRDGDGYDGSFGLHCGGPDCDDGDDTVFPGNPEECGDGIDQDCSGADLECPQQNLYFHDADGDGYGDNAVSTYATNQPPGYVVNDDDCDDTGPDADDRYPGNPEECGDGIDQDCSGADLECPQAPIELGGNRVDDDGDGYADEGIAPIRGATQAPVAWMTVSFPEPGSIGLRGQPCIFAAVTDPTDPDTVQGQGRCMPAGTFDSEGATRINRGGAGTSLASDWPDAWVHQRVDCEASRQGVTGQAGHTDLVLRMRSPDGVVSSTFTVVYDTPAVCSL